ncbi:MULTISPECIES: HD-GYP domain-containing protein [Bhargavaea]|uniref:HD-GYP domain-containing protein n=1 Tax=Bhargavaea changchunensis TaxID=2134037 RepID=A0ABW2NIB7_9BACL|nr:HD-GYP domain-containing protein [Bhargavaea sp. CC-171006]
MKGQILERLLNNPLMARYAFFGLLIFSVFLDSIILNDNRHFFIFSVLSVIFLGIGFSNKPKWYLFALTLIVVTCRYYLVPDTEPNAFTFILYLLTYFLITLISAELMKFVQKVRRDHLEITTTLTNALDSRDPYTANHSENVAKYALQLAEKMALSREHCGIICEGALLHDIGKIGVPEHILSKEGKLTVEEYEIIKTHPKTGFEMIKHIGEFKDNGVLDIVLYHHERFDGKGYPAGLKGHEIPLFARIVSIADAFDAMRSKRVYRDKIGLTYTLDEIRKGKGAQFDPEIADVFLSLFEIQDTGK